MEFDGGGRPMEFDGGGGVQLPAPLAVTEASASAPLATSLDEESMWQMNLRVGDSIDPGPYPERPGEPDCSYYLRTGLCRFGITCRFNHPPNRKLAVARMKGGFPERVGQPECQYYLKTGTCKFGPTCKFHHPKDKAGITGRVQVNILGYPLRPNEKECAYYLRTGQCKFGNTCKFHHPPLSNATLSLRGSPIYPSVQSPTTPGQQSLTGALTNWSLSKPSFISPRWQGSSSYAQLILPQGLVQVPSWSSFPGQFGSASSPESQQQNSGNAQFYGASQQSETSTGSSASFSSFRFGSVPMGQYALQRESIFPERPGEPECQFYMKTGDCKFGAVCRFHHPRERLIPAPNCVLSPLGLPFHSVLICIPNHSLRAIDLKISYMASSQLLLQLRLFHFFTQGEPLCIFYSRYGICKFGPNCKFDHPMAAPMGILTYSLSASSSSDVPVVRRLLGGSSSAIPALTFSSDGPLEASHGKSRRLPLSDSPQMDSGDENVESE